MEKGIVISVDSDKQYYLSNLYPLEFSDKISEAKVFESNHSARYELEGRFISLANWVYYHGNVSGIFICGVVDSSIVRRERFI